MMWKVFTDKDEPGNKINMHWTYEQRESLKIRINKPLMLKIRRRHLKWYDEGRGCGDSLTRKGHSECKENIVKPYEFAWMDGRTNHNGMVNLPKRKKLQDTAVNGDHLNPERKRYLK